MRGARDNPPQWNRIDTRGGRGSGLSRARRFWVKAPSELKLTIIVGLPITLGLLIFGLYLIVHKPPEHHTETAGGSINTWTDYQTAGGTQGMKISAGQTVQVACRIEGYQVPDGDTWWYRVSSPPWAGHFYATADGFYNNGKTSGTLNGTPPVDDDVPEC